MSTFRFHVGQQFDCTYIVNDADTAQEAWERLTTAAEPFECIEQYPGEITSTLTSSAIAIRDNDGDWKDVEVT